MRHLKRAIVLKEECSVPLKNPAPAFPEVGNLHPSITGHNTLEREKCQRADSINKYLELTVNKIVKTQVLEFWGFYQHSTSLSYIHLHMNCKIKTKNTHIFIYC